MPDKTPKTNLSSRSPNSGRSLDVYGQAQALVQAAAPFISRFSRFDRKLGGQLKAALPSVMLNLAEGLRRVGGDRNHLITVALGSTDEVQSIFDVGRALGIVSAAEALTVHEPADRVCAMAYPAFLTSHLLRRAIASQLRGLLPPASFNVPQVRLSRPPVRGPRSCFALTPLATALVRNAGYCLYRK